jgi:hypothetical protein
LRRKDGIFWLGPVVFEPTQEMMMFSLALFGLCWLAGCAAAVLLLMPNAEVQVEDPS